MEGREEGRKERREGGRRREWRQKGRGRACNRVIPPAPSYIYICIYMILYKIK